MGISDSGMDARCFSLTSPSLTKQKGTPSFSVPLSLTILFLFHAKDKNKDNGKKDIFACTDFFFPQRCCAARPQEKGGW